MSLLFVTKGLKLVNRVDKLTFFGMQEHSLQTDATFNKLLQSFVLHMKFSCQCKVTLQVFVCSATAMCFTRNFVPSDFHRLFQLLYEKYNVVVKSCSLCTTVWNYTLLSKVNLFMFYKYIREHYPSVKIEYEPELFACLNMVLRVCTGRTVTCRVFHSGKVNVLGVTCSREANEAVAFIDSVLFDYSIQCSFDNF